MDNMQDTILDFKYKICRDIELFMMMVFNYDQMHYVNTDNLDKIRVDLADLVKTYNNFHDWTTVINLNDTVYESYFYKNHYGLYFGNMVDVPDELTHDNHVYHLLLDENSMAKKACDLFDDPKVDNNWSVIYVTDDTNALDKMIYMPIDEIIF